jgi:hypothetical protein
MLLAALLATIHVFICKDHLDRRAVLDIYLLYFLILGVGVIGAIGFVGHVFFANQVAEMIGWPTGSPFQFEVGLSDGAWALLGFLCYFIRGNFWIAAALGWSFFLFGAAVGHIEQTVMHANYAPYNYGIIVPDILVPTVLMTLIYLRFRLD